MPLVLVLFRCAIVGTIEQASNACVEHFLRIMSLLFHPHAFTSILRVEQTLDFDIRERAIHVPQPSNRRAIRLQSERIRCRVGFVHTVQPNACQKCSVRSVIGSIPFADRRRRPNILFLGIRMCMLHNNGKLDWLFWIVRLRRATLRSPHTNASTPELTLLRWRGPSTPRPVNANTHGLLDYNLRHQPSRPRTPVWWWG